LGIEAGFWEDSLDAGQIGIRAIEEYTMREERTVLKERLKATSGTLMGMAEKLGKCTINDSNQEVGDAGPGESWREIGDELKSALRAVQEDAQLGKNQTNLDADGIEEDAVGVKDEAGRSA
jgi:hypothetical protein